MGFSEACKRIRDPGDHNGWIFRPQISSDRTTHIAKQLQLFPSAFKLKPRLRPSKHWVKLPLLWTFCFDSVDAIKQPRAKAVNTIKVHPWLRMRRVEFVAQILARKHNTHTRISSSRVSCEA